MHYQLRQLSILKLILLIFLLAMNAQAVCQASMLTPLSSVEGRQFLLNSHLTQSFLMLSENYITQENQAYCSIASSVMVLNALKIKPQNRLFGKYNFIDQDNFFSDQVLQKVSQEDIRKNGLTLDQLGDILKSYPIDVSIIHAKTISYEYFLKNLIELFKTSDRYMIVNFLRAKLGQPGGGHFSPIAAYDPTSEKVLVMDVARYKYYPYWVSTHDLWNAMQTLDNTSLLTRGYIIIKKENIK
jgi:hypothetical protein